MERAAGDRCQRHRWHRGRPARPFARPRAGRRSSFSTATSATARQTGRGLRPLTASHSVTRKSGSRSAPTAGPRTRRFSCPMASPSTSPMASGSEVRRLARHGRIFLPRTDRSSRPGGGDRSDATPHAAGGLGPESSGVPRRREGCRRARGLGESSERARAERPVVAGRLGRPRSLEQDDAQICGGRGPPGQDSRRQECPLRRPRARDGLDHERVVADQGAAIRRDLLHLQRLRAPGDAPLRADGAADDLRLHARRDGGRRGRPDPSAGRAPGIAARHSGPGHAAARRRQRSGGGLPLHHAAAPRACGAGALSAAAPDPGSE